MRLLIFLVFAVNVHAGTTECLDKAQVRLMQKYFEIRSASQTNACEPKSGAYRVYEALIFLHGLQLGGPKPPAPFNQDILPQFWINYIHDHAPKIHSFRFDARYGLSPGGACAGAVAYIYPSVAGTMYFCASLGQGTMAEMLEAMIHEARHLANPSPHVRCLKGTYAGTDSCDAHPRAKKAFATGLEAMAKLVVSATNINPALREQARDIANWRAKNSFNEGAPGVLP